MTHDSRLTPDEQQADRFRSIATTVPNAIGAVLRAGWMAGA